MTRIDFYTEAGGSADDKLDLACRIAQKAWRRSLKVVIFAGDAAVLTQASDRLWSTPATGFVPHCRASDALATETPIVLAARGEATVQDQVLINLDDAHPPDFARFERLAEIVSTDENDRVRARERFRFYRERGYEITTHRMSEAADG